MNDPWVSALAALFCAIGAFFYLASAVGLLRLPDFFTRVHAPTKAATLGIMFMALGSMVLHVERGLEVWLEDLLLILFVFLTVPVSSQMLVRAAAARGVPQVEQTRGERPSAVERLEEE
jgi:multicomponent K+:H+ antiporter subunit G